MSPDLRDPIATLEARIAELERARARPMRLTRRLALLALAVALLLPAGAVLASHQFSDVPTSHQFHNSIDAIADAGITTGCGGGRYCPNGLVTRGQMAAFLNRLGALSPGSEPKANADRIDGLHANQLIRISGMEATATTFIPSTEIQYGSDLVITAPTAGFVSINASVTVDGDACDDWCWATMRVRHVESGGVSVKAGTGRHTNTALEWVYGTMSVHPVFQVQAGVNTFRILVDGADDTDVGPIYAISGTANAIFSPFGATGSTP